MSIKRHTSWKASQKKRSRKKLTQKWQFHVVFWERETHKKAAATVICLSLPLRFSICDFFFLMTQRDFHFHSRIRQCGNGQMALTGIPTHPNKLKLYTVQAVSLKLSHWKKILICPISTIRRVWLYWDFSFFSYLSLPEKGISFFFTNSTTRVHSHTSRVAAGAGCCCSLRSQLCLKVSRKKKIWENEVRAVDKRKYAGRLITSTVHGQGSKLNAALVSIWSKSNVSWNPVSCCLLFFLQTLTFIYIKILTFAKIWRQVVRNYFLKSFLKAKWPVKKRNLKSKDLLHVRGKIQKAGTEI